MVLAISSQNRDDSIRSRDQDKVTFPIGYGLDAKEFSGKTGVFYNEQPRHLHAAGFLLDPAGLVAGSVYSSGAIGRYTAADVLAEIGWLSTKGEVEKEEADKASSS